MKTFVGWPMRRLCLSGVAALALFGLSRCGTTVGNGLANVNLASSPYNGSTVWNFPFPLRFLENLVETAFAGTITSFKFCATELKLEDANGEAIDNPDPISSDQSVFGTQLGIVDLGNGTASVTWGAGTVPTSAQIKRFKIQVEQSAESCGGANYSVSVNGQTITKGVEFLFDYATSQTVMYGATVTFSMAALVNLFTQAIQANAFNDQQIGNYFDSSDPSKDGEGSAD